MSESIDVRVESLAAGGDGVAHDAQGRVVFVPLSAPGDRVRVRLLERRKRHARGEVLEVLEASPHRVVPRCDVFGTCGGCTWQHVDYPTQLQAKAAIVADALRRLGRIEVDEPVPITPSPAPYGYRARARLVEEGDHLGYRMRRSHRVCVVKACPVLRPELESVLARPRRASAGREPGSEWELAVGSDGVARAERLRGAAGSPGAASELRLGEDRLRVSHGVFAQANALLLESLATAVSREACKPGGGVGAVELYAGAGLFTLALARRFDQVWAVESHPGAVADLRFNLGQAGCDNVHVHEGPVEGVLPAFGLRRPDVLLLDPPRTGVTPAALACVVELAPARIVYLSCDPATLARDLARLRDDGYRVRAVEAFDLFPQTPHVEVLATLEP